MHINWELVFTWIGQLLGYLRDNRLPISLGAVTLATAGVKTMPALIPRTAQDWWTWFGEWAHQVFNTSKSDRQAQSPGK